MSRYKTHASVFLLFFILSTIPFVQAASCPQAPQRSFLAGALSKILAVGGVCTSQTTVTEQGSYWIHPDYQGSMNAETDSAGNAVFSVAYRPYGSQLSIAGSSTESLGYTGQREDPSTGLLYLHARYYDPILGRFISPDPVIPGKEIVHLNRYAYADNNPINKTDVTGMGAEGEEKRNFTFTSSKKESDVLHAFAALFLGSYRVKTFQEAVEVMKNELQPNEKVGTITFITHGVSGGMFFEDMKIMESLPNIENRSVKQKKGYELYLTPEEAGKLLKENVPFANDAQINLTGCNTGAGCFAQKLADAAGVPVKAPVGIGIPVLTDVFNFSRDKDGSNAGVKIFEPTVLVGQVNQKENAPVENQEKDFSSNTTGGR